MSDELTIGGAISILVGLVITIIQFSIPSLEGTLLSLTKDIIIEFSTTMPSWFNFIMVSLINIAIVAGIVGSLMAFLNRS